MLFEDGVNKQASECRLSKYIFACSFRLKALNFCVKPNDQLVEVFALHLPSVYQTHIGGTGLFFLTL
jgi:hypothetical protein